MATFTTVGPTTGIMNTNTAAYSQAALASQNFFDTAFSSIDVFDITTTMTPTINHTPTRLTGHDGSGTLDLTGTGFQGGSFGPLGLATKGTITHAVFDGDAGGGFEIIGSIPWTTAGGLGKGSASFIHTEDNVGNATTYGGKLTVDGTSGSLDITGTITHMNVVTAAGITFDLEGSFNFGTAHYSMSQLTVSDNSGHSVTIAGKLSYEVFVTVINATSTFADFFDHSLWSSGADVFNTTDGSTHAWDGGAGNDTMTGGATGDTLSGGAGNDTLNGMTGNDLLSGGIGDDVYFVNNISDVVVENFDEGKDTVHSTSAFFTLGNNIENLIMDGTGDLSGTGNTLSNIITGNAGKNQLDGGFGGVDTLIGGAGDDFYVVRFGDTKIIDSSGHDSMVLTQGITVTMANGIEDFQANPGVVGASGIGNSGDNFMRGNEFFNTLTGGSGDDTLDGDAASDVMNGGMGDDEYFVDDVGDQVIDSNGHDTVFSTINYTLAAGFEDLLLYGSADPLNGTGNASDNIINGTAAVNNLSGMGGDDSLDGFAGNDVLVGGDGDDWLDGGDDNDNMTGGLGDDFFFVDNASDTVHENAGQGTDWVVSNVDWVLAVDFENLFLQGSAINGTGNGVANSINGTSGNNTLDGMGGADHLNGLLGDDVFIVDNLQDVVVDTGGTDQVNSSVSWTLGTGFENLILQGTALKGTGNNSNNIILGNASNNTISGSGGDDTIATNGGIDTLTGGTGHDLFYMNLPGQTVITDFKATEDILNIGALLTGYVDGVSTVSDFAQFIAGPSGHMLLQIDANGNVGGHSFATVIDVKATGLDATALELAGHLVLG